MAGFDMIELETGYAAWMRGAHCMLGLLALAGILGSGAGASLVAAAAVGLLASFAVDTWRMHRQADTGRLRLCGDRALLCSDDGICRPATLCAGAWVCPWFCLLRLRRVPDGRLQRRVVCRSRNHPDDYRRLLVRLRFGNVDDRAPVWIA
jgi:hypothetical protein